MNRGHNGSYDLTAMSTGRRMSSAMSEHEINSQGEAFTEHHKDESVCARGRKLDGELHGYWEWFRKDGTCKRSGSFDRGVQIGVWTTYDSKGIVYKVTNFQARNRS